MKLEEFVRMSILKEDKQNSTIYAIVEATHTFPLDDYSDFLKLSQDEKAQLIRWGQSITFTTIIENEEEARRFYDDLLSESVNNSDYLFDYEYVHCTALFIEKCDDITDLSKRTIIKKSVSKPLHVVKKPLETFEALKNEW